jgi:hypothetical protein
VFIRDRYDAIDLPAWAHRLVLPPLLLME